MKLYLGTSAERIPLCHSLIFIAHTQGRMDEQY